MNPKTSTSRSKKSLSSSIVVELGNNSSSGENTGKWNDSRYGRKRGYDDDDDSSIEDGLLNYVAFSSSSSPMKKAKFPSTPAAEKENTHTNRKTSATSGHASIQLSSSSVVRASAGITTTATDGGKMKSKSEWTEEKQEAKAKQIVRLAYIPPNDDLKGLYWYMKRKSNATPSKKRRQKNKNSNSENNLNYSSYTIFPCRECHPDEIIGLNLKQNFDNSKQALVEYIDIGCKFKDKNLVNRSSMWPYYGRDEGCGDNTKNLCKNENGKENGKGNGDADECNDSIEKEAHQWNPEIMTRYLAQERNKCQKRKKKSGIPVDVEIRALELFLQRILEKFFDLQQKQKEKEKRDAEEEIEDNQEREQDKYDLCHTVGSARQSKKLIVVEDEDGHQNCARKSAKKTKSVASSATVNSITTTTISTKVASSLTSLPSKSTKEDLSKIKIGSLVSIYWEDDDQFYSAKILSRKRGSKHVYKVEYEDGSTEKDLNFRKVKFHVLDGKDLQNVADRDGTALASSSSLSGAITSMIVSQEIDDNRDGDNNDHHRKNNINNAEDSDDCSYFSDFAEEYQHKSERIRPRDIIEYYKPTAIFGDPRNLVEAEVLSVDPRGNPKLKLSSAHYLDDETKVRRIKIIMRGKLIDYDKGTYKAITQYKLSKADSGKSGSSGIVQEARRMARIIKKNKKRCIEDVRESGLGDCSSMFLL